MSTSSPFPADPYHRGSALSRSFLPLALITLGVVFLLGNLVPDRARGGLIVLGLGVAFMVGRMTTGRYGYAVPAGILIAVGTFISLQQLQLPALNRGPGLFFVLLGLGFALVYVLGGQPSVFWPLFPATILLCLGLVVFGLSALAALAGFAWIISFWPVVLVLLGVWLLFRDQIPEPARRPIATIGGLALLGYGILAAAASMASGGALARTEFAPSFGQSPFSDTITLDAPLADGQTLNVNNSRGRTVIHAGSGQTVHVVATRRYSLGGEPPQVRLNPTRTGLSLDASSTGPHFPFGTSTWIDYAIDVPSSANLTLEASSGQLEVDDLSGAVQAHTSSGSIELHNIVGDVRASTSSGQVRGTQLRHVRQVTTSSGYISLEGVFTDQTQIRASSGTVNVHLLPGSAVQLDVRTGSGTVIPTSIFVNGGETRHDRLSGKLGEPAPGATLSIETSSGSVLLSQ